MQSGKSAFKFFSLLLILLLNAVVFPAAAQQKGIPKKGNKSGNGLPPFQKDTRKSSISEGKRPYSYVRNLLLQQHQQDSEKGNETNTAPGIKKRILAIMWLDENLMELTGFTPGALVSIGVLTEGYATGDTVHISVRSEDEEPLMAGADCNNFTFVGKVNSENMALLEDLFSVEGPKEQIVIDAKWQDRYFCK